MGKNIQQDSLGHYCGVAAVFSAKKINVPEKLFYSLFSLQHRGQESAGISYRTHDRLVTYKDLGMVSSVLSRYLHEEHPSNVGIGHVRYSTHGGNRIENAQPILVNCNKGNIALAHNGNLSNTEALKNGLFSAGSIFQSTSDTELILHLIARSTQDTFNDALLETLKKLEGAFSMVMIHEKTLIAIRDPHGFRPLYLGWKDGVYFVASETCGLDIQGVKEFREIQPGEIVFIKEDTVHSEYFSSDKIKSSCIFELIYFARPDSDVYSESVYSARKTMGKKLAQKDNVKGDVVVPVPDSGNTAALGYAQEAGIPFELGLTRNHYAGRSFIMPTTAERELAVRIKLHPVRSVIEGKKIILVDDSLVRGTTSKALIRLLRDAGAKEIHLRLSSPELKYPCYFGIDIPTRKELISNHKSPQEIAEFNGADSLMFLNIEDLKDCVKEPKNYCYACFNGEYHVNICHTGETCEC